MADQEEWKPNKKGRPCGSGTTSHVRREQRKMKQWSFLEKDDPSSRKCLEKHRERLQEAWDKADKKLRALEKVELDAALGVVYSDSSATEAEGSWKRSTKGKKAKKGTPAQGVSGSLEKDKAESLEKDKAGPSQESRPGKNGPRKVFLAPSDSESLSGKMGKLSLEKDKEKSLEKDTVKEEGESLEKDKKKPNKKGLEKPKVLVDWHWTLEVHNDISPDNMQALEKLLEKADVHLLSYVGSWKRQVAVLKDMANLPAEIRDKLASFSTTWEACGVGGKCDLACRWGCSSIFDDTADIINESLVWGLDVYAIKTPHEQHDFLEKKMVSPTFAAAVKAWLRKNG